MTILGKQNSIRGLRDNSKAERLEDLNLVPVEVVIAANAITKAESGKIFILSKATGFNSTLPTPKAGLNYRFIVGISPTTAYTIKSNGDANIINGQVASAEDAAGSVSTAAGADIINFVANKAIIGDYIDVVSDGTSWFVSGLCNVQDAVTTVQTA